MKSTKKKLKARKGILFMQSQFVFSKLIFLLCISLSQVSIVLRATSHIVQSSSSIIVILGNFFSKEYNTIISDCFIYHNTMVINLKSEPYISTIPISFLLWHIHKCLHSKVLRALPSKNICHDIPHEPKGLFYILSKASYSIPQ